MTSPCRLQPVPRQAGQPLPSSLSQFQMHRNRWIILLTSSILAMLLIVVVLIHDHLVYQPARLPYNNRNNNKWRLEFRLVRPSVFPPSNDSATSSTASGMTKATFKIMQLADLHLGEDEYTDWGPMQDIKTWRVLDTIIPLENPDLIVLSGDQITAGNVDANATAYYRRLGEHLSYHGIPWACIFGNHDDAPFEVKDPNGTIIKIPAKTSRAQLLAADQQFPLSMTQSQASSTINNEHPQSSSSLFGTSNYVLNVHYPPNWKVQDQPKNDDDDVAVQLFFLDSGGGSLVEQLEQNQIYWLEQTHRQDIPGAVVFQHIPTTDFAFVMKNGGDNRNHKVGCRGLHDDPVNSLAHDPGIVSALQRAQNIPFLAVGHNHGNDYCCPTATNSSEGSSQTSYNTQHLHLCYGRHSGYGGYGKWDRGARIYELDLVFQPRTKTPGSSFSSSTSLTVDQKEVSLQWRSYVRLENGDVTDFYEPSSSGQA